MTRTYLIVLAVALAMAPLAYAHNPMGTPKLYCEPVDEWIVHEYGAPATGRLIQAYEDGNLADCDGVFTFEPYVNPADPLDSGFRWDPPLADFDGHAEFSRGGAWILVESGTGEPSADPTVGAGTLYCFGDAGHHPKYGPFWVNDTVIEEGVSFLVAADITDLLEDGDGCGDFTSDVRSTCIDTCKVTFPPGLDGTYQVYVQGTQGHVTTAS